MDCYQFHKKVKIDYTYVGVIQTGYNVKWLVHKLNVFVTIDLNNMNI